MRELISEKIRKTPLSMIVTFFVIVTLSIFCIVDYLIGEKCPFLLPKMYKKYNIGVIDRYYA